ncbi:MAG: hypothetical protein UV38_C0002G0137 [candidate division TM6 bacterium GW2011_GWE2_42_60]|nr:MAG: hypothetical protein UV38_C0002G0137 [candidate division TM6 bacterium GW2011_GWE2_42_60]HBY06106.1 TlyA family rRNA (cytidine-2'-O)-methyltransferase [Candidatus Dependentiae bacterium]
MSKKRLDAQLAELFPQYSRTQLQGWIVQGKVLVKGHPETKAGTMVADDMPIELLAVPPKYVSRGGLKLERALEFFKIDVSGLVALDAGISTGGFTDCLLQHGVRRVYGIDVGYGQVHEKLRTDPRVSIIERTNFRQYVHEGEPIDLITLDLSFISLLKVVPTIWNLLRPGGQLITLIKPQFEVGKGLVPDGGVLKDVVVRDESVKRVVEGIQEAGFVSSGVIPSPITGADGNVEFLAHFVKKE